MKRHNNEEVVFEIEPNVPWSLYLRTLVNLVISSKVMAREDIEQRVREYEKQKVAKSTEKQVTARTQTFLNTLFGKSLTDWPTFVIFAKCLRYTGISITVKLEKEDGTVDTFTVTPKKSS